MKNQKICAVCGKPFDCSPSSKKVTCSPECSRIHRSRVHRGVSNRWNAEAKARKSAEGITGNLRMGTPAARQSPKSGRFETNVNAQHWIVKSPTGVTYEFTNLMLWARGHCELFGKPSNDKSARQIANGFYTAKRAMLGKPRQHTPSYMGWKIL